jgi:hypothetical protein
MIRRIARKVAVKKITLPPIRTEPKKTAEFEQKQRELQMSRADCDKNFQSEWDIFCSDSFHKKP